ncbi:integrase, catalytic region, zinc finger, CCHC-type containing protein [Tanacetum coccineum]
MSSNSDDIQAAGSDTRPPMLDRTDCESWSQRIRLYCRGKENGLQILQSIDQGPFELGTTRDTLGTTLEGGVLLGPERPRTYEDLSDTEKKRYEADVRSTNIVLQGLPKDIYKLINHNIEAKAIWDNVKMLLAGSELTKEDQEPHADECDAFDSDVDDEPTAQSIFMANLSSAGSTNPQAGPSSASILSEVHIQDEHEIHNEVQQGNVIDTTSVDVGNSNVIPYEQYLLVDNISVVPSCASSALNDVCVSSDNYAFVPHDPIATELKIYKEQVAIYEQRAKFELTEREHRMDDQMRMLIQNRNKTEENLKEELHSVNLQLNSTMENNKIFEETITTLKHEFKQKESKFLTDFSNLKHLNDKLENKLHSQDQSIQTVHMMLNPAQVYDQRTKTTLGAQNPFHLRQAKKAQPALYDGEELLKTHHVPVNVPSSEEELELAETTRNKLHAKMNDSACVEKRVNITPPNYSKENFMATFTPQTQLTPEQVFWSIDLEKRKAKELKANAPPLPVLPPATVYPPNTPVHLVPRTLPTTSQVNIGLYVITQLFWDFEKTCKKRITPTGITEGERGFEQTKRCYLTEVIPFFNLLKEHFDEVQKSLVTEVRAMKAVFENLEAEVDQNEIDLKSGEIERKNLLITNENLIAECLSKDVFYTTTDSVLNVSRFSDMHDAFTIAQKRIVDLESENFNIRNKIQNDDHDSMIKHFSKLENKDLTTKLNALHDLNECFRAENAKVKQHYKELYDSIKITRAKTTDQNNSLLSEIEHLKDQLRETSKCVTIPDCKPKVLAPGRYPIDVEPIPSRLKKNREVHLHYIERLKENVETLREIVEDAKVERPLDTSLASACRYTKHSQELLEYVIGTCPKDFGPRNKQNASTNSLRKKGVTFVEPHETSTHNTPPQVEHQKINSTNVPGIPSTGVKGASAASRSKPRSNTKKDRTLPAKSALKQIQHDDHDSMIKHFSKLEVEHFNLQLKYQNLKERFGNKKPVTSSDAPSFDSLFVIGKLNEQIQSRGNMIRELKEKISRLTKKNSDTDPTFDLKALVSQNKDLTAKLNALHDLNECFRAENAKVKQHYKELYDSIKITRAKTTDQNNSLLSEIEHLKDQLRENSKCVTIPDCKPKVLAPGRYLIDVDPISPRLKKNREVHLYYIKRLKECVKTLHEIVEDAMIERPLDTYLASTCCYTKHSQELLEYVIGTCPKDFGPCDKQNASTKSLRKKGVTFVEPCETSTHNTPPQVEHQIINSTNVLGIPSTRVKGASAASRLLPLGDQWPLTRNTPPKVLPIKQWKPTGRLLPLGRQCPLVRSTALKSDCLPADPQETISPVAYNLACTNQPDPNCNWGSNVSKSPFSPLFKCRLYRSFSDLEVAFKKHTCFVRDLDGVDLIKGSRGTNLYTISVKDMMRSSPICLLSKASKNKSWLWQYCLNHLNFGTLNDLARKDLVRGLPRLKFEKDHLCSACQLGKSRKATHKPKTINTITEVLHTLHMDLCGPLRVQSINGKKYILVIVDDYSRFTWVKST